jgi:hypothetical protein
MSKSDLPHDFEIVPVSPEKVERDWKKLKIDHQVLVNMLSIGLNRSDVAFTLGCSVEALEKRVEADFEKEGYTIADLERWYSKMYIRQVVLKGQIAAALDGEWKALEWLGKNYLGQTQDGVKAGSSISGASVQDLIRIATQGEKEKNENIKTNKLPAGKQ